VKLGVCVRAWRNTDNTIWNKQFTRGWCGVFQLKGFFETTTEPQNILLELRTWLKRPRKPLADEFPQVVFLKISLNITSRSESFNSMSLWVYRTWNRQETCHQTYDISNRIKARKSKLTEQLRWLPTVLTVSSPEKRWRTKNDLFVSTLGLSSWNFRRTLTKHLEFLFRSFECNADCCHGNKRS